MDVLFILLLSFLHLFQIPTHYVVEFCAYSLHKGQQLDSITPKVTKHFIGEVPTWHSRLHAFSPESLYTHDMWSRKAYPVVLFILFWVMLKVGGVDFPVLDDGI